VFRDDGSYSERLKKLNIADAKEADRRLAQRLDKGTDTDRSMNRYQVADSLRAQVLAELPKVAPWSEVAPPAEVATALESFLIDEYPPKAPDISRLTPLGVDAVLELVIEDFGMRSSGGKAGVYLYGYARLFRIDGGTLYRRAFFTDELKAGLPPLDPFEVAKKPSIFGDRLRQILNAIALRVSRDLTASEAASQ
jgi:hypothetical protein